MTNEYNKVEEINPDEYKTVIKYAVYETHDGVCKVLTEKTKVPSTFGNELDKASVVFGCFGVALHDLVPQALAEMEEDIEEANSKLKKAKGKPKLEVVK